VDSLLVQSFRQMQRSQFSPFLGMDGEREARAFSPTLELQQHTPQPQPQLSQRNSDHPSFKSSTPPGFSFNKAEASMKEPMELPPRAVLGTSDGQTAMFQPPQQQQSLQLTRPSSFASTVSAAFSPELPRQSSSSSLSQLASDGDMGAGQPHEHLRPQLPYLQSTTSQPVFSSRNSAPVHIVWDLLSVPLPVAPNVASCLDCVQSLAAKFGYVSSFKCIASALGANSLDVGSTDGAPALPAATKAAMQEQGVEIEEVVKNSSSPGSFDLCLLYSMMSVLVAAMQQPSGGCTLVLLSNNEALARSLTLLRRSRFSNIVVVHHSPSPVSGTFSQPPPLLPLQTPEPIALIRNASTAFEWGTLLKQGSNVTAVFVPIRKIPEQLNYGTPRRSERENNQMHNRASSLTLLTPQLSQPPDHQRINFYHNSSSASNNSSPASSGFISRASTPFSSSRGSSQHSSRSSSISIAASPPPLMMDASGRTSMGSLIPVPAEHDSNSNNISELSLELQLQRLPAKLRGYLMAFKSVLAYCESERVIPRSVE
jgi:hypothetical protein